MKMHVEISSRFKFQNILIKCYSVKSLIVLDPWYSTHDQDENDTRSMAALCQSLLRLRDASRAALIVVHHVRKSIGRDEIGRAFCCSSALHAVRCSYCC